MQSFEPTTTPVDPAPPRPTPATAPPTTAGTSHDAPQPSSGPQENNVGIVPPRDVQC